MLLLSLFLGRLSCRLFGGRLGSFSRGLLGGLRCFLNGGRIVRLGLSHLLLDRLRHRLRLGLILGDFGFGLGGGFLSLSLFNGLRLSILRRLDLDFFGSISLGLLDSLGLDFFGSLNRDFFDNFSLDLFGGLRLGFFYRLSLGLLGSLNLSFFSSWLGFFGGLGLLSRFDLFDRLRLGFLSWSGFFGGLRLGLLGRFNSGLLGRFGSGLLGGLFLDLLRRL